MGCSPHNHGFTAETRSSPPGLYANFANFREFRFVPPPFPWLRLCALEEIQRSPKLPAGVQQTTCGFSRRSTRLCSWRKVTQEDHRRLATELLQSSSMVGDDVRSLASAVRSETPYDVSHHQVRAASTSAACSSGLTLGQIFLMTPSGPMRKVTRWTPRYLRPMKTFSPQTP